MHRIDSPNATIDGKFQDGNGEFPDLKNATELTPQWLNDIQENLMHVIKKANINTEKGNQEILFTALKKIIQESTYHITIDSSADELSKRWDDIGDNYRVLIKSNQLIPNALEVRKKNVSLYFVPGVTVSSTGVGDTQFLFDIKNKGFRVFDITLNDFHSLLNFEPQSASFFTVVERANLFKALSTGSKPTKLIESHVIQ